MSVDSSQAVDRHDRAKRGSPGAFRDATGLGRLHVVPVPPPAGRYQRPL